MTGVKFLAACRHAALRRAPAPAMGHPYRPDRSRAPAADRVRDAYQVLRLHRAARKAHTVPSRGTETRAGTSDGAPVPARPDPRTGGRPPEERMRHN